MAELRVGSWPGARRTPYEAWVHRQGVPVVEGYGLSDPDEPEFGHWDRIAAEAYFVIMKGMEGITGQYVARLPTGGSTKRERHLYEKVIYVVRGSGATVVEDAGSNEHTFEWHGGSLFAIPLNCWHRIYAMGQPVQYIAFTTAPMVFDLFYTEDFIYNTPYAFRERFAGESDYFRRDRREGRAWETNFIPDVRMARIDPSENRGPGALLSQFEIAENSLIGHLAHWPAGRYMLAHYHGGGAILLIIEGEGFSLMWSNEYGERPFEAGHGDKVVRINWKAGSSFSPPTNWYHQHFNTGPRSALQLALRNGSWKYPLGIRSAHGASVTSTVPLDREDPAIRRMYEEDLSRKGVAPDMPAVAVTAD